ncbi:MAG: hypothetical protein WAL71_07190 [Terriglobales bacterium]|jgi:hypothetical protein
MIGRLRRAWNFVNSSAERGLRFDRPLVLFQSDDWGRVGVRDRQGWDELRANGVDLGQNSYDSYSLETAGDLQALAEVLKKHRDSVGRPPCIGMNFVMANLDFRCCAKTGFQEIPLLPLTDGLPSPWQRPLLTDAYRQGIRERVFYPALHGLTHFCVAAVARELAKDGDRRQLLHALWHAATPYIHWRMPWIGYEYWDSGLLADQRFLSLTDQRAAIQRAAEIFRAFFASIPFSACAPGYRANHDTKTAWFEAGVRVVQGGPGERIAPLLDSDGMLLSFRNVEMEPATAKRSLKAILKQANDCLARGIPAVVSIHSINFHSTIRDFRTPALAMLDDFLSALEKQWPELLYVHDGDLWHIATEGVFAAEAGNIKVGVTAAEPAR